MAKTPAKTPRKAAPKKKEEPVKPAELSGSSEPASPRGEGAPPAPAAAPRSGGPAPVSDFLQELR